MCTYIIQVGCIVVDVRVDALVLDMQRFEVGYMLWFDFVVVFMWLESHLDFKERHSGLPMDGGV